MKEINTNTTKITQTNQNTTFTDANIITSASLQLHWNIARKINWNWKEENF